MHRYQRLTMILIANLFGILGSAAVVLAEPGIAIRGEIDVSGFPISKLTVSGTCDRLSITEAEGRAIALTAANSPQPQLSRKPTQTVLILDITAADQQHKPMIDASVSTGLRPFVEALNLPANNPSPAASPFDQFAAYVPTADGIKAAPIITWTTEISALISVTTDYSPLNLPYTGLKGIIRSTLSQFLPGEESNRSIIVYTNGIDFEDNPYLSAQDREKLLIDTNQLIQLARQQNVQIHMVFYKGRYQNRKILTQIADGSDGSYHNLADTPQLRQLWKLIFPPEERCRFTYPLQHWPPAAIVVERANGDGSISRTLSITPTWTTMLLAPTVTVSLPIITITGTAAISLTGEQLISIPITVSAQAESAATAITNTTAVTKVTEITVSLVIAWVFPEARPIKVRSLLVTLTATRSFTMTGNLGNQLVGTESILSFSQLLTVTNNNAQNATVLIPIAGLPFGQYHVAVQANADFGLSGSAASAQMLLINAPEPIPLAQEALTTGNIVAAFIAAFKELDLRNQVVMMGAILALTALFMALYFLRNRRIVQGFELKPTLATNQSIAFQTIPWVSPRSILYRNTLQRDTQQVLPVTHLEKGVKLGWAQHEAMKKSPGFFDIQLLTDDAARGNAYRLTEKNGEFWIQQANKIGEKEQWEEAKVISAGKEIKLNQAMGYRFYPLRRGDD